MNSAQRRKQRRFVAEHFNAGIDQGIAAGHEEIRRALRIQRRGTAWTTAEIIKHEIDELARRWNAAEGRLTLAKEELSEAQAKLTAAAYEIRKLTENAKKYAQLVAELQIALRHAGAATSIFGKDPGHMAVATVESVNNMRKRILAATGHACAPPAPTDVIEVKLLE